MICNMKKVPVDYTISLPVRRTGAYSQKKSTWIVADTVANVIAALLTYTMLVQVSDLVSGYFIEWPIFFFS